MGYVLEMKQIKKSFPGVKALDGARLQVREGEIHALMGENGAGKSTLIKILTGVYKEDEGEIRIDGNPVHINGVRQAAEAGVSAVFQELNLIPYLDVAENIFLGAYPCGPTGSIDRKKMYQAAETLLENIGLELDVRLQLGTLGTAAQQMVSIARAVNRECRILVLDEPTSSLDGTEVKHLFGIMRRLKDKGIGILFISHRLDEVFEISDAVTILRDGKYIGTYRTGELTREGLVTQMVGRQVEEGVRNRKEKEETAEILLKAEHLSCFPRVRDVSFEVRKGEVLGLTGLLGSGRSETAQLLFGCARPEGGTFYYKGREIRKHSPEKAIRMGMAFCTENRREEGIIPDMSVRDNVALSSLKRLSKGLVIDRKKRNGLVERYVERLRIKTPGLDQKIRLLSGGNQQKAILARWLATRPDLMILDEPTRGIDVGAKQEIEKLVLEFAEAGISIIYISSELSELVRNCDRVIVLSDGRTAGELAGNDIAEGAILAMIASGGRTFGKGAAQDGRVEGGQDA